jgi:hypothetical protein
MVHRDRQHRARYHRDWSPIWGPRLGHCDCNHRNGSDGDEFVYALVGAVIGLLAALVALVAAIIRRPALAATFAVAAAVGLLVAVVAWGWRP